MSTRRNISPPRRSKAIERPGLTEDEVTEIREAFNLFDTDGAGLIDPKELRSAMASLGFESKNPTVYQMFVELERECAGPVDFDRFLDGIVSKLGDRETRPGLQRIFNLFDVDRKGVIDVRDLKRVSRELGESMSDEELREMVERASNSAEINFEDFYSIMTKKHFP